MRAILLCTALLAASVQATTYKCKDAKGNWTEAACTGTAAPPKKPETHEMPSHRDFQPYCSTGETASELIAAHCLDEYRNLLNDPRSAYLVGNEIRKRLKTGELRVLLDARAKNKFGAYIPLRAACELTADGEIDTAGTASDRKLWSAFEGLGIHDQGSLTSTEGCP